MHFSCKELQSCLKLFSIVLATIWLNQFIIFSVVVRVSDSITIIASSIIDYFGKNVRIFRLIRLFRLLQNMQ